MITTCTACKGTGLQLPLCDGPCGNCGGSGQVTLVPAPRATLPPLPATPDGDLVAELLELEQLGDWETDFVISIESQVRNNRALTDRQRAKAKEILAR